MWILIEKYIPYQLYKGPSSDSKYWGLLFLRELLNFFWRDWNICYNGYLFCTWREMSLCCNITIHERQIHPRCLIAEQFSYKMGYIAWIEAELFIEPGIKRFKDLNPHVLRNRVFSRTQSSAYHEPHQKMKSGCKVVQLFLKIAWTKCIRIMQLHPLRGACRCLPSYQSMK